MRYGEGAAADRAAVLDVVLVAPQIAMNTGNIIRLSANVGARLHLVDPLGFSLDSAAVRRGGLDYHELADVQRWASWADCRGGLGIEPRRRWFATTAAGGQRADVERPPCRYDECAFRADDVVVFGCEERGLPAEILTEFGADRRLTIPMRPGNRSLNVANAVAVVTYEAWRQQQFAGAAVDTGDRVGAGTFGESPGSEATRAR